MAGSGNGKLNWIIILVGLLVAAWGSSIAYAYCVIFPKITESIVVNDRIREAGDFAIRKDLDAIWKENYLQHLEILSKLTKVEIILRQIKSHVD